MVKTPKTRHSKPKREPVTIDLDPASVSRESDPGQDKTQTSSASSEQPGRQQSQTDTATGGSKKADAAKENASATASSGSSASTAGETRKPTAGRTKAASADTLSGKSTAEAGETGIDKSEEKSASSSRRNAGSADSGTGGPTGPSSGGKASTSPPPSRRAGAGAALGAGVLGGIVALVLAGALQWAGAIPAVRPAGDNTGQSVETLRQDVDSLKSDMTALRESAGSAGSTGGDATQRLDALEGDVSGLQETVSELQSSVSSGGAGENAGIDALETRLADLEKQVAGLAEGEDGGDTEAAQGRLSELGRTVQSASSAASAASNSASANSEQLQSLEDRVAELGKRVENNDQQPRLALVMAASALKSAVERGTHFASELETYAAVAENPEGLDDLRPYAEIGVPTRAEIEAEAGEAASRMIAATGEADANGGVFDRLMASARALVTVRPVGEMQGDGVGAIAARIEAAARSGDYDKALREYDTLPEEAKTAAGDFAEKLRARRAADRIVDQALSNALKPA